MISLEGSHGTARCCALKILSEGFKKDRSRTARLGYGVYFWLIDEDGYWRELAKEWHAQQLRRDAFDDCDDTSCAILIAKVKCADNEAVDVDQNDIRALAARLGREKGLNIKKPQNVANMFEMLIRKVEEQGTRIKVVLGGVPGPDKSTYPQAILGWPKAIAVRDIHSIDDWRLL